ncbi:MAG: hypothetical protein MR601_01405, partial [Erysipelotrichaceae bacterium]|nr:hypothetical protein [Erysipelotrichaceae bacterium]
MKKLYKILLSILCLIMLFTSLNVIAEESVNNTGETPTEINEETSTELKTETSEEINENVVEELPTESKSSGVELSTTNENHTPQLDLSQNVAETTTNETRSVSTRQSTSLATIQINSIVTTPIETGTVTSFYVDVQISGTDTLFENGYSITKLPKNKFDKITSSSVSTAENVTNVQITEDSDFYYVKMYYKPLSGGTQVSIPLKVTLSNNKSYNGEVINVYTELYNANNEKVSENSTSITASTSVLKIERANTNPFPTTYYLGDGILDSTKTLIINSEFNVIESLGVRRTSIISTGGDSRPIRLAITIPENVIFDSTINNEWMQDPTNDRVIYKDINFNGEMGYNALKFKFNNYLISDGFTYKYKANYINDDGSLDEVNSAIEKTQKIFFRYVPITNYASIKKDSFSVYEKSKIIKLDGANEDLRMHFTLDITHSSQTTTNEISKVKYIEDIPQYEGILYSYSFNISNLDAFESEDIQKLSNNKLVGVLADGSEEVILEDINFISGSNRVYKNILNPKYYKSIKLIFDEEINIKYINNNPVLKLFLSFGFTENELNNIKTELEKNTVVYVYKTNNVHLYDEYGNFSKSNTINNYRKERLFFRNSSINFSKSIIQQNENLLAYSKFQFANGITENKILNDVKFIILADPEFIYNGSKLPANETAHVLSESYETIYDYKGTGKTAYIHSFEKITMLENPNYNNSNFNTDVSLISDFTAARELTEGQHIFEGILFWGADNDIQVGTSVPTDKYDVNNNGDFQERFGYTTSSVLFTPPKELVISKKSKYVSDTDTKYALSSYGDEGELIDYSIEIFNNSDIVQNEKTLIDVLPYVGDKSIVKNQAGEYVNRGSEFKPVLVGPLTPKQGYTYYYSVDTPKGTIEENVNANWSSSVSDYTKVTMVKIVMDSGYGIQPQVT